MTRIVYKDSLDNPSGDSNYWEFTQGLYDEGHKLFKFGDNVTVTVEHGEGIVSRLEAYLKTIVDNYEDTKTSTYADKSSLELTESLISDLKTVLEVQEP